jgi:predicted  nucleic acid-binding Zn-ribbon protein
MRNPEKTELKKSINHILDLIDNINETLKAYETARNEATDKLTIEALNFTIQQHQQTKNELSKDFWELINVYQLPNPNQIA